MGRVRIQAQGVTGNAAVPTPRRPPGSPDRAVTPLPSASVDHATTVASVARARIEQAATADPTDPAATAEALALRHREVVLTGDRPEELIDLGRAVDAAIQRFPADVELRLLRAAVALVLHRPDIAAAALDAVPGHPRGRVLAADLALFRGDHAAAYAGYTRAAREFPSWETTARLAALATATGRFEEADGLYAAAEDDVADGEQFAWLRVQRAALAQALGDLDVPATHLTEAERAHPGWWYVVVHRAALDAELDRLPQAAAGYRAVLADVDRPEFREAHGSVLAACGDADAAAECHAGALSAYLASAARGERHHLPHLAAFYADVRPSRRAALLWAQQDVELRRTGTTLSMLGWCLFRAGRTAEALAVIDEAFARGAGDPLLRSRARAIRTPAARPLRRSGEPR